MFYNTFDINLDRALVVHISDAAINLLPTGVLRILGNQVFYNFVKEFFSSFSISIRLLCLLLVRLYYCQ